MRSVLRLADTGGTASAVESGWSLVESLATGDTEPATTEAEPSRTDAHDDPGPEY
jgi:hypothetical protein